MGHRDSKTTEIYADYQPSDREAELVERAFGRRANSGANLSETEHNPVHGDSSAERQMPPKAP